MTAGQTLVGKVSWFGGPGDPTSGSTTASGKPVSAGGIAVYDQATLGGWWAVTFPNGRTVTLQQNDIGPAPWTGRVVDVDYASLAAAGYTQSNFPTGSTVKATYLGKSAPSGATSSTSSTPSSTSAGAPAFSNAPGGIFKLLEKGVLYAALVVGAIVLIGFGTKAGLQPEARR
jgi:hypothetical protein